MKSAILFLFTIILTAGVVFSVTASEIKSEVTSPEESIISDEDIFIVFIDEPQHHYMRALENFLKHDWEGAAIEIRKGAAFMKLEAARAEGDVKKELLASGQMLEKLANDIKKGAVRSAKDLQDAFGISEHAAAKHHYLRAVKAWGEKKIKTAGNELHATAVRLEHAFAWTGQKLEVGTIKIMDDVRHIAGKLINDTGWAVDKVGKAIESLEIEIEMLPGSIFYK
jgi:hypothetical protein